MNKIRKFFYVNWLNIFLAIILSACSIFIYSISNSIFDFYKLNNNVDGMVSTNSIYCKISGKNSVDLSKVTTDDSFKNVNIFVDSGNKALKAYKVIILNKQPFDILEGNSFETSDYSSGIKTALVGSHVNKLTNIDALTIDGELYDVIGQYNNSIIESQNYVVLYCDGNLNDVSTENIVILDGQKRNLSSAYERFKDIILEQGLSVEKIAMERISLTNLLSQSNSIFSLTIFAVILLFLVYLLLVIFWIHSKEQYIGVCNIIGIQNIKRKLFFEFYKLYFFSYVISTCIAINVYTSISYTAPVLIVIFVISMTIISLALFAGLKYSDTKNIKSILENDYE